MLVRDLLARLESIAPLSLAEGWDNVGLIIGSPDQPVRGPVLLTIDLTERVAHEAIAQKAGVVVAYHPPLFDPVRRLVSGPGSTPAQRVALDIIKAGIAVYSPHTALDATPGGVTDWLADGVIDPAARHSHPSGAGLNIGGDRRALKPYMRQSVTRQVKIVTFLPEREVETVRAALASAGAGLIGEYELCSFSLRGTGTFQGKPGASPAVGQAGRFETVEEVRLEMVCSRKALGLALQTLSNFHPYEEPAIDIYPLEPEPDRTMGVGRRLTLDKPATLDELCRRLKKHLGIHAVQVAAPDGDTSRTVSRVGLIPGAGGSVASTALADGCDVFVTGEMKHHEVSAMLAGGMAVILGGHTATERGYLPQYKTRLEALLPEVPVVISREDKDPIELK